MVGTEEEFVTRSEAARLLDVHYNTVRLHQKRGKLSTVRRTVDGVEQALIPLAEIERLLAEAEAEGRGVARSMSPEAMKALEAAHVEIARLQAENEGLKAALEDSKAEKDRLLAEILEIARAK